MTRVVAAHWLARMSLYVRYASPTAAVFAQAHALILVIHDEPCIIPSLRIQRQCDSGKRRKETLRMDDKTIATMDETEFEALFEERFL
jgi:hypothetical protein